MHVHVDGREGVRNWDHIVKEDNKHGELTDRSMVSCNKDRKQEASDTLFIRKGSMELQVTLDLVGIND